METHPVEEPCFGHRPPSEAREEYSEILREADTEHYWLFHRVFLDESIIGLKPRIIYDNLEIDVYISIKMDCVPYRVMHEYMKSVVDFVFSESDILTFGPRFGRMVKSNWFRQRSISLLARSGLKFRIEDDDPYLNRCLKEAIGMTSNPTVANSMILRWRLPETTMKTSYIATTSPDCRLVTVDTKVGRDHPMKMIYIIFHELCVVASYSYRTDEVDEDRFRAMIRTYESWELLEKACECMGWRFRYEARDGEEEKRW